MKSAASTTTSTAGKPARRETLNLRIPAAERSLIEAPAKPNARLRRTMRATPPWQ